MITDYVVGVPNDLHTAGSVSALHYYMDDCALQLSSCAVTRLIM